MKTLSSDSLSKIITAFNKTDSPFEKIILKKIKPTLERLDVKDCNFSINALKNASALLCTIAKGNSTVFAMFIDGDQPSSVQIDILLRISRINSYSTQDQDLQDAPKKPKKVFCVCLPMNYYEKPIQEHNIHIIALGTLNDYISALLKLEEKSPEQKEDILLSSEEHVAQIDDFCLEKSNEWATALASGFLSDARDIAKRMKRASFAMRITSDFSQALEYVNARGEYFTVSSAPVREAKISETGINIIKAHLTQEEIDLDTTVYNPDKITLLCWGNDMKWAGKWKFNKLSSNVDNPTAQTYSKMLSLSGRGIVIYIPNTAEMVATKRALIDSGVFSI